MKTNRKIIFLTGHKKEKLLETLVDKGSNIIAVIVPNSSKYKQNFENVVATAKKKQILVICPYPDSLEKATEDLEFYILLSCGYPFLISKNVFLKAKFAINFHPALLPKNRGKYVHYVLINNEEQVLRLI